MLTYDVEESEIYLYGELGPAYWGLIDTAAVDESLRAMGGKHVMLRINSPGGSVDESINIYQLLKRYKGGVTTIIDSQAASMGSYLMQVGQRRIVSANSMLMIHEPWTITLGNAAQLRKDAEILDKYALRMIPDYADRSGKSHDEILSLMSEESWFAGQEIIDAGFADEMETSEKSLAKSLAAIPDIAALQRYAHKIPASLLEAAKQSRREVSLEMHGARKPIKRAAMSVEEAKMKVQSLAASSIDMR